MFYPYEEATWSVVEGAMFTGWGTSLPGWTTFIAAVLCCAVLVIGQKSEVKKTKRF